MSNQNTNVLRSLVVLRKGDRTFYSVGRPIRNVHRFKLAMEATGPEHDHMGAWLGASYHYDACVVVEECCTDEELAESIARLRGEGLVSQEEMMAARPRAEKYRALVSTLRTCGLKVTIRNADECGETKRLSISGTEDARQSFLCKCSVEQAQWVKATFKAVDGRPDLRAGVVRIAD